MKVQILQVLSPMQKQIYINICKGATYNETADKLGIKKETVRTHWKRIKKKIEELEKSDIEVIMDIFEEESERSLPKNRTVKQMQFLSQVNSMHTTDKVSPAMKSYYRNKIERAEVHVRKMTPDELKELENEECVPEQLIPLDVINLERHYRSLVTDPNASTEEMARMEVILRAFGVIYYTPSINKLNAKTTKALRAKEEGYDATLVKPGEGIALPQGSKFLESVRDDNGNSEYSVWLVPQKQYVSSKQETI